MSPTAWALLAGNFAIGCGVMVAPATLNDLAQSLDVSVAVGGQLITAAAAAMAFGAPLLAAVVGGWDRRRLLTLSLLWYAGGHLLCAVMPSFATLLPVREQRAHQRGFRPVSDELDRIHEVFSPGP